MSVERRKKIDVFLVFLFKCLFSSQEMAIGDSEQGISLGPKGKGAFTWGRGASEGMSQSVIGSGQENRANRCQIL